MDSFNFFFSFYGLLLGFAVATIARGLAGLLSMRRSLRVGILPWLLGIFLLQDIATLWVIAWYSREHLTINYLSIYGAMIIALAYNAAAVLAFPLRLDTETDLEAHYWQNKRLVFGAVIVGSGLTVMHAVSVDAIALDNPFLWFLHAIYWLPLAALLVSKRRALDVVLLGALIIGYLAEPITEIVERLR